MTVETVRHRSYGTKTCLAGAEEEADGTAPPVLGRLASRIALLLMGKHKPIFDPSTDCGDYVVVTDCSQIRVTGKKLQQKKYYSHSTRPGRLKEITMEKLKDKWGGSEILMRAVRGMVPKNRLKYGAGFRGSLMTAEPKSMSLTFQSESMTQFSSLMSR